MNVLDSSRLEGATVCCIVRTVTVRTYCGSTDTSEYAADGVPPPLLSVKLAVGIYGGLDEQHGAIELSRCVHCRLADLPHEHGDDLLATSLQTGYDLH